VTPDIIKKFKNALVLICCNLSILYRQLLQQPALIIIKSKELYIIEKLDSKVSPKVDNVNAEKTAKPIIKTDSSSTAV
jgi:hypothetical protein